MKLNVLCRNCAREAGVGGNHLASIRIFDATKGIAITGHKDVGHLLLVHCTTKHTSISIMEKHFCHHIDMLRMEYDISDVYLQLISWNYGQFSMSIALYWVDSVIWALEYQQI